MGFWNGDPWTKKERQAAERYAKVLKDRETERRLSALEFAIEEKCVWPPINQAERGQ